MSEKGQNTHTPTRPLPVTPTGSCALIPRGIQAQTLQLIITGGQAHTPSSPRGVAQPVAFPPSPESYLLLPVTTPNGWGGPLTTHGGLPVRVGL